MARLVPFALLLLTIVAFAGNSQPAFAEIEGNKLEWTAGYPKCASPATTETAQTSVTVKWSVTVGTGWSGNPPIAANLVIYENSAGTQYNIDYNITRQSPLSAEQTYTITNGGRSCKIRTISLNYQKGGQSDSCQAPDSAAVVIRNY